MVKKIILLVKKVLLSFFVLYGFNVIAVNFDIIIPINIITVLLVSLLGLPALFSLVLLLVMIY